MTTYPEMRCTELAEGFRSGSLSLQDYLTELEGRYVAREPGVLAFVPEPERFDRMRQDAVTLAERWPDPVTRPPLFGVPVGIKDIFQVEGFVTRAGSRLPADELQGAESDAVTALKRAGVLIMGKTITTEFAYFGPGPTRNPHNPLHTPGGSSSGSAAAAGARMCPLTVGTQTIGSVVRPAAFCGCVGFKPTFDRISRAGVIPLSPSLDHVGFFAVDVAGIELAASVLCDGWKAKRPIPGLPRLGIPRGPYLDRVGAETQAHYQAICLMLERAGHTLVQADAMSDFAEIRERHYVITAAEAARVHRNWFARYQDLYHAKTVELLERGLGVLDSVLAQALAGKQHFAKSMQETMEAAGIDLWVSPSAPGTAPAGLDSTGDPVMNLPWSQAGLPSINLPSGFGMDGLPLGLQLTGRFGEDEALLSWSSGVERVLRGDHSE